MSTETTDPIADLLDPLAEAEAALKAAKASIRRGTKAVEAVRSAHRRAAIAEAELEALRGGIRVCGGDPTNVQNMYAQLASRTRQWKAAEARIARIRAQGEDWALLAAPGDVGMTPGDTAFAEAGRIVLAILAASDPAVTA